MFRLWLRSQITGLIPLRLSKMRVWDGCSRAGIVFGDEEPLSHLVENDVTVGALTDVLIIWK